MNKVYKTVWNKALGAFVAASEVSKSRSGGAGSVVGTLVLLSTLIASPAFAQGYAAGGGIDSGLGAIVVGGNEVGGEPIASGNGAIAVGRSALATGDSDIAMGVGAVTVGGTAAVVGMTAIGNGTTAGNGVGATALGSRAFADQYATTAVGLAATATNNGATALGSGTQATGEQSIAIGGNNAATLNDHTIANNSGAIAIGARTVASGGNSLALGVDAVAGNANAIALGAGAQATGVNAISIGTGNVVSGTGSGAIGDPNIISGSGSYALGNNNTITGNNSFVVGNNVTVGNNNNVVLGNASADKAAVQVSNTVINATTYNFAGTASGAVSVGAAGAERQIVNVAPGAVSAASTDAVNGSQLFATNTELTNVGTTLTNINNGAGIKYFHSNSVLADSAATGTDSVAVGPTAAATATDAIAVGHGATAGTANSVALGAGSTTAAAVATTGATVNGTAYTFAGGAPTGVVSVGTAAAKRQLTNVAAGQVSAASTDAVNGSQLFATNTELGNVGTTVNSLNTTVTNINNGAGIKYFHANSVLADSAATGTDSVAVGPTASATATDAMALGHGAVAGTANSVALGAGSTTAAAVATAGATINGTAYTFAGGAPTGVVSVGTAAAKRQLTNVAAGQVSAASTDAVNGSQLFATNTAVNTLGTTVNNINNGAGIKYFHANSVLADSAATGTDSVAVGPTASATATDAMALGHGAVAGTANSVALGAGSTTAAAVATTGATINGTAYTFAGGAPTGVVSVGTAGAQRQLTNVAAGQVSAASTDAVNGSQLFATNTAVNTLGTTVNNINNGAGIKYFHANSALADSSATGVNSVAVGPVALSLGVNSVAVGPAAVASAANAAAFGNAANASTVDSVALGSGSTTTPAVATTGATINGTAYTFAGGAPASVVSVGSATVKRQLTNVAAGQVNAVSTDAVNGSQLFATNTAVNTLGTTVNNINNGAGIKYFHSNSVLADSTATGTDSVAVGPTASATATDAMALGHGAVAGTANSVALGAGSTTAAAVATTGATINGTAYTFAGGAPTGVVSVGTAAAKRQLTNVAAGQVSATSTDAVNGSQLFATNSELTTVGNTLTLIAGNTTPAYITLNGSGVKYVRTNDTGLAAADSHATVAGATALGYNATASHNQSVAIGRNSLADGSTLGNVAYAPIGGTYAVAGTTPIGEVSFGASGSERRLTNVAAGANDTDAVNVSQLKAVDSKITTLASNAVSYDSPAKGTVTLGGPTSTDGGVTNGTKITNLQQGSTAAGSTDAVNGTQINTLGTSIANNLGGGSVYNSTTGTVTAPSYNLTTVTPGGTTTVNNYTDVGSALTGVSTSVTNVNSRVDNIANGGGIKYFHANSTAADSSATGADSVAVGPRSVASNTSAIAMGNDAQASGVNAIAIGTGARVTGNNSGSFGDPNVVNANNAYAFGNNNTINAGADNSFVMGNNVTVNNANNVVLGNASADKAAVQVSSGTINGVTYNYAGTASGAVSVGAAGAERQVVNVAPGAVSATSTDAINGSQLYATNQAVAAVANGGAGTVQYSNPGTPTTPNGGVATQDVTLVGATPNAPVALHNVAAGTAGTDAANVNQLNNAVTTVNNRLQDLGNRVESVNQDANAGTAGAMAMAGMPQAFIPGKSMLAAGVAGYAGEAAVAIGVSTLSDNGRWIAKFGGSANSRGKLGVSAGVGFHW